MTRSLPASLTTVLALGAALAAALGAVALVRSEGGSLTDAARTLAVLGTAPLLFAIMALVDPKPRAWLRGLGTRAPLAVAGLVALGLFFVQDAAGDVNPFGLVVTFATVWAIAGVLNESSRRTPVLAPADALAFLALWIPLDARLFKELGPLPGDLGYAWWSLAVTFVALAGWAALRDIPSVGFRPPTRRDVIIGIAALLILGTVLIPAGLGAGFLKTPHLPKHDAREVALEVIGLFLLVALPEEVLFRGVLDGGLRATLGRPWVSLVVSSVLFGLSHWPRVDKLSEKVAYCTFASIAGVFYGLAYRKSDGLAAPILCHTLVDTIWKECLHR